MGQPRCKTAVLTQGLEPKPCCAARHRCRPPLRPPWDPRQGFISRHRGGAFARLGGLRNPRERGRTAELKKEPSPPPSPAGACWKGCKHAGSSPSTDCASAPVRPPTRRRRALRRAELHILLENGLFSSISVLRNPPSPPPPAAQAGVRVAAMQRGRSHPKLGWVWCRFLKQVQRSIIRPWCSAGCRHHQNEPWPQKSQGRAGSGQPQRGPARGMLLPRVFGIPGDAAARCRGLQRSRNRARGRFGCRRHLSAVMWMLCKT